MWLEVGHLAVWFYDGFSEPSYQKPKLKLPAVQPSDRPLAAQIREPVQSLTAPVAARSGYSDRNHDYLLHFYLFPPFNTNRTHNIS